MNLNVIGCACLVCVVLPVAECAGVDKVEIVEGKGRKRLRGSLREQQTTHDINYCTTSHGTERVSHVPTQHERTSTLRATNRTLVAWPNTTTSSSDWLG